MQTSNEGGESAVCFSAKDEWNLDPFKPCSVDDDAKMAVTVVRGSQFKSKHWGVTRHLRTIQFHYMLVI